MEIRANREDLIESLTPLTAALGRNATNPCVEFIAFDATGDQLTATANDLSMSITVPLPATILTPGKVCVKGAKLLQALDKFEKDEISLVAEDRAAEARLSCGKAGISIPALPFENFTMPKGPTEGGTVLTLPARTLKTMLQRVQYASGINDNRVILNGTYLCAGADGLTAVCCDGFRLAKISGTCPEPPVKDVGVIIPRATAAELAKLLPTGDKDTVKCLISGNNLLIETEGISITSRLLDGKYIDYRRISDSSRHTITLEMPRNELLSVLNRAAVISEEKTASATKVPVVVEVAGQTMTVSANSSAGASHEEIEIQHEGEDVRIGFNNRHLIDTVKAVSTEKVRILISGPATGVHILPADGNTAEMYFVMPVRLKTA